MKPLHSEARQLAEKFAGAHLDRMTNSTALTTPLAELREAALNWIEHHTERKLGTRELLEKT
jgi:hypothetical protein